MASQRRYVIACSVALDVRRPLASTYTGWPTAASEAPVVLTTLVRSVLVLRWLRQGTLLTTPVRDAAISITTCERKLYEGTTVLAAPTADLPICCAHVSPPPRHTDLRRHSHPSDRTRDWVTETALDAPGHPNSPVVFRQISPVRCGRAVFWPRRRGSPWGLRRVAVQHPRFGRRPRTPGHRSSECRRPGPSGPRGLGLPRPPVSASIRSLDGVEAAGSA